MQRRDFFRHTVATGIAVGAAPALRAESSPPNERPAPSRPGSEPWQGFELNEITVKELSDGMANGKWSSRRITELYLTRIESVDRQGPKVNSVIEVNPDAIQIADAMDAERKAGKLRGPLHGIPILIKDNIDTADRMQTTAGSLALEGSIAPQDAGIVAKLRAAGAVIIGKTNLSEWANYRSTNSSSGWSGRGGQTHNPYVLDRNPCGSSSGSGAAGAANLAAITIGTETDGSIVCPSSINGLVGIKPTVGLWSRAGIIPVSTTQDTAGPMCRTVADAAVLLGPLTGEDPRDGATAGSKGHSETDYRKYLDPAGLKGARIGVSRKYQGISGKTEAVYEEAIKALKSAGAVIIDPVDFVDPSPMSRAEFEILDYEFKAGVNAYLAALGAKAPVKSLKDVIEFNERNKDREMPFFGQEILIRAQAKGPLTTPAYRAAVATARRLSRGQGIDLLLAKHRLDAIIAITAGPSWPIDLASGDRFTGGSSNHAAVATYATITVPAGNVHGLPVGMSFIGGAWTEGKLIRLAYAFEQTTKARQTPKFLTTLA